MTTSRWLPAGVAAAVAVVALAALAAHASQALAGAYLSYVSGIWLALGRDLSAGVLYRDLIGPLGYGGTRYFPLFFTVIAALLRVGLPPLAAGWTASAIAGLVLATGLARVGRALGAPRSMQWLLGAAALAPYFVQQTLFEVRADVIAAGLNLWGLASMIPVWREPAGARPRVGAAAAWFTLAFAAKITSVTVPACVAIALVLSGRGRTAVRFGLNLVAGFVIFFVAVQTLSAGRALESWRACMFAGSSQTGTVATLLSGDFIALASFSHLLTVMLGLVIVALIAALAMTRGARPAEARAEGNWRSGRSLWLPVVLFAGVTASTALTLSSPGTVPSNQVVEWLQISLVALVWVAAAGGPRWTRGWSAVLAVLVVWMTWQDVVRVRALWETRAARTTSAVRNDVVALVGHASTPSLAESALWPVLAGQQAYLLDPFALRVVMQSRPDIAHDLESKVDAHYFSTVIFQVDPTTAIGRGYYEHVNFGWPITARILEQYRFDRQPAPDVWIYVPRSPPAPPGLGASQAR